MEDEREREREKGEEYSVGQGNILCFPPLRCEPACRNYQRIGSVS